METAFSVPAQRSMINKTLPCRTPLCAEMTLDCSHLSSYSMCTSASRAHGKLLLWHPYKTVLPNRQTQVVFLHRETLTTLLCCSDQAQVSTLSFSTYKLLCSKEHHSSRSGISKRFVCKSWGFCHTRLGFTSNVSRLLAKS